MNRHYEYVDADGKHWCAAQELSHLPRENMDGVIRQANRLLANLARGKGWNPFPGEVKDGQPVYVHTWHPNFPMAERMKRINAVNHENGYPPLYDETEMKFADTPHMAIMIAQHDKDGKEVPHFLVPPLARSHIAPPVGQNLSAKTVVIQDMGGETPAAPVAIQGDFGVALNQQ